MIATLGLANTYKKTGAPSLSMMMMVLSLVATLAIGCGSSRQDFVFTGTGTSLDSGAQTGDLTFFFTQPQAQLLPSQVPAGTVRLAFEFFEDPNQTGGKTLSDQLRDYSDAITIVGVPVSTQSVRVTALGAQGIPLALYTANFTVPPGGNLEVDLGDGAPVAAESLAVLPATAQVNVNGSQTFSATITFDNGFVLQGAGELPGLVWSSSDEAVAEVSNLGVATGLSAGSSNISAAYGQATVTPAVLTVNELPPVSTLTSLEIASDPDPASLIVGEEVEFTVLGTFTQGEIITIVELTDTDGVSLVTTPPTQTVLSFSDTGLSATGIGAGTVTVFASVDVDGTPLVSDAGVQVSAAFFTERVSLNSSGIQANNGSVSLSSAISADGRYVAFVSTAVNLVSGDTNNSQDIFLRDRESETTTRVSVDSAGNEANGSSSTLSISADGRFVAFGSFANNLVAEDTNNSSDIFLRDLVNGTTTRVSVDSLANEANSGSIQPSISADGRFVAFASSASNLVSGDTNGSQDIFVHDRQSGITTRVSLDSDGNQANAGSSCTFPSISADGRFVAFLSTASNLVPGDTNNTIDVFVRDRQMGTTTRVNVNSDGNQSNPGSTPSRLSISADGRIVVFDSDADNLVSGDTNSSRDVFVHDLQTGSTTRVSLATDGNEANGNSFEPSVSSDGRFIAFESNASNLVTGDTNSRQDIFVHDRQRGTTTRLSVTSNGTQANNVCDRASISADGRFVSFESGSSNLVPGDTNGAIDVFVSRNPLIP